MSRPAVDILEAELPLADIGDPSPRGKRVARRRRPKRYVEGEGFRAIKFNCITKVPQLPDLGEIPLILPEIREMDVADRIQYAGHTLDPVERTGAWANAEVCPRGTFKTMFCEGGHIIKAAVSCNLEYCEVCGSNGSLLHLQRFYRAAPKVEQIFRAGGNQLGYWVVTIPEQYRDLYLDAKKLNALREDITRFLSAQTRKGKENRNEFSPGYSCGMSAWHYCGEDYFTWKPHLNLFTPSGYISSSELKLIKLEIRKLIDKNSGADIEVQNTMRWHYTKGYVVNYSFIGLAKAMKKKIHSCEEEAYLVCEDVDKPSMEEWVYDQRMLRMVRHRTRYVVRPTFKNFSLSIAEVVYPPAKIKNRRQSFRNIRWWGKFVKDTKRYVKNCPVVTRVWYDRNGIQRHDSCDRRLHHATNRGALPSNVIDEHHLLFNCDSAIPLYLSPNILTAEGLDVQLKYVRELDKLKLHREDERKAGIANRRVASLLNREARIYLRLLNRYERKLRWRGYRRLRRVRAALDLPFAVFNSVFLLPFTFSRAIDIKPPAPSLYDLWVAASDAHADNSAVLISKEGFMSPEMESALERVLACRISDHFPRPKKLFSTKNVRQM